MEHMGLGALLSFEHQGAVRNMGEASQAFATLEGSVAQVRRGVTSMIGGMRQLTVAAAGLSVPIALGAREAMRFSQAMGGVAAVSGASSEEISRLRDSAQLFAQTPFGYGPTEVASAMENLSRAGFSTSEIMDSTRGVLAAAAAEGMNLAEAADIIAVSLRGMGMEAKQSGHVADALATISAKTVTSIRGLGESFSYAAGAARTAGMSFDETAGLVGLLADRGIDASMAGTSVVQFLNDLANPMSKRAQDTLKQMGLTLGDLRIRTHGLTGVVRNLRAGYGRLNEVQQERAAMNLGDIRSARVINALIQDQTGRLDELIEASRNANGEAEEMAQKRLVNLTGAFKMAGNSAKVFWSELFNERVLTSAASVVGGVVDKLNQVTWVLGALNRNEDPFETIAKNAQVVGSIGEFMGGRSGFMDPKQAVAIGRGIYEGFQWFRDAVVSMVNTVKSALERLGLSRFTGEGAQDFARLATAGTLLAAVLGPVLLGLGGAAFAAGGLFKVLGGGTDIVGGLGSAFGVLAGTKTSGIFAAVRDAARVGGADAKVAFLSQLQGMQLSPGKTALATSLFNLAQLPGGAAKDAAKGIGKAMLGINPITQKAAAGMAKFGRQTELGAALLWNTTPALRKFGSQFTIAGRAIQQTAGPALHSFGAAVATAGTAAKGVGGRVVNVLAKVGAPIASIFSPLMPAVTGIGSVLGAAFGPVLGFLAPIAAVVGIVAGVFLLLRKRGESVGDTFQRIGGGLVGGIMAAVGALPALFAQAKDAVKPLIEGILAVSEPIAEVFQQVVGGLLPIIGSVAKLIFGVIGSVAKAVFALAGGLLKAVGAVLRPVMSLVRHVFPLVKAFFTIQATVLKIGVVIVGALVNALGRLVLPIVEKIGDWFSKFGPMLRPIGDILLWPFKKLSGWLADLLRSLAGTPLLRSLGLDLGDVRKLIVDLEDASGRRREPTLVQERVTQGMPLGPGAPMMRVDEKVRPLWGSSYLGSPDVIVGPAPTSAVDVSGLMDTAAKNRGAAAAAPNVHVTLVDKTKTELRNETSFNVDGSEVAHAVTRRMLDVRDRAGAQSTPWQRRFVVEHGVAPA